MTPPLAELQEDSGKWNLIFLITKEKSSILSFYNHLKPPHELYCTVS